jgi:hypothetical protein
MFLHAKHAAIGGSKSINIVSSDTDVVVIGVSVFDDLNVDHLWITYFGGLVFPVTFPLDPMPRFLLVSPFRLSS